MRPAAAKGSAVRQRILDTASRLFYQDGLRATGIDRIIAESGVAKMSFYRHFPSKADLIAACLEIRHESWMNWFKDAVDTRIGAPGNGLEVVADVLADWFHEPTFRGCLFINTVVESGSLAGDDRRIAVAHKAQLAAYLKTLAKRLGLAHPQRVADAAMIIVEGAIVRMQMTGDEAVVVASRDLLQGLGREPARASR